MSVMEDGSEDAGESFLRQLKSISTSSACEELTHNIQKDNLLDTLEKCCKECNTVEDSPLQEHISSLILHITTEIQSQQFDSHHEEDGEYESPRGSLSKVESLMTLCKIILSCLVKTSLSDCTPEVLIIHKFVMKKVAVEVLILCASHIEEQPWTSEKTRTTAKDILDLLCNGCKVHSVSILLSGCDSIMENTKNNLFFQQGLLPGVLDVLHSKINTWPPLPRVVFWCVMQIQYPNVGKHFSRLLPLLLKLIDDHQVINKVIGVQGLHHIMKNTNTAELLWYGRIDVIFEVLHHLLYLNEPLLLDKLYPCMLLALQVIKSNSGKTNKQIKESDSFVQTILTSMEYESRVELRRVHAAHLGKVVEHMQINLLRYFKRFLAVVLSYLTVNHDSKEDIRIHVLQALKASILHVWPRIARHADVILEAILKLVVDCFDSSIECREKLLNSCTECIIALYYCYPSHVKKALQAIKEDIPHTQLQEYVGKVLGSQDIANTSK